MDQDAINLAKAMRHVESGSNYNAKGASGENGGYQFMPSTWKGWAKEVLGDENAPMTPQNQNAVAYVKIKGWKDQGLNVAQIAAKWNSGSEVGWENKIGKNAQGVEYNVPKHVKAVTEAYQQYKQGTKLNKADYNVPSTPNLEQNGTQVQSNGNTGALGTNPNDSMYGKLINNSITGGIMNVVPGAKQLGEGVGTGIAQLKEVGKGLIGGQDNSQYIENAKMGSTLAGAGKVMVTGALTGLTGVASQAIKGNVLKPGNPGYSVIKNVMQKFRMPMAEFSKLSKLEKIGALKDALSTSIPESSRFVIEKALQELTTKTGLIPSIVKSAASKIATGAGTIGGGLGIMKLYDYLKK